jgi:hypothetical protein
VRVCEVSGKMGKLNAASAASVESWDVDIGTPFGLVANGGAAMGGGATMNPPAGPCFPGHARFAIGIVYGICSTASRTSLGNRGSCGYWENASEFGNSGS